LRQTQISYFGNAIFIKEDITGFDVPMNNILGMQSAEAGSNLLSNA